MSWSRPTQRSARPRVSMHIAAGVLTIINVGRCSAEVTDLRLVPTCRRLAERRFPTGSLFAEAGNDLLALADGIVTLAPGDRIHALIDESMIDSLLDPSRTFDAHGCASLRGRDNTQFSNLASFGSRARHDGDARTAERELRARLLWGFS